ncbi:MAG: O-methyltransferase [Chlamydiales bacterium]|jgi:O-methyltransferase
MNNFFIVELYEKNRSMINMECALNIYHLLSQTLYLEIPGDVVECGSYRGLTAVMLQKTLDTHHSDKHLHLFDSFEGLPEKTNEDLVDSPDNMRKCDYKDNRRVGKGWFQSPEEVVLQNFQDYNVKPPYIHKGWFNETLPLHLPETVSFAHIDGDFYSSTMDSLKNIYPRMPRGAIAILDDYCDPDSHGRQSSLPGVKIACDEFFADKSEKVEILAAGSAYHAYFKKE